MGKEKGAKIKETRKLNMWKRWKREWKGKKGLRKKLKYEVRNREGDAK